VAYTPNSFVSMNYPVSFDPTSPSPRHSSASWATRNDSVFLFGGIGAPAYNSTAANATAPTKGTRDGMHNDMWRYSFRRQSWSLVSQPHFLATNLAGIYPTSKRTSDFSIALSLEDSLNLTHISELTSKRQIQYFAWPGARQNGAVWLSPDDRTLWMFGGYGFGQSNASSGYLADLWQFDPWVRAWIYRGGPKTLDQPDQAWWPGARSGSVTWTTPGKLWMFGGYGPLDLGAQGVANRVRNDLWCFNLVTSLWTLYGGTSFYAPASLNTNYFIAPRTDPMLWVGLDGLVWVFGGYGTLTSDPTMPSGFLNDLWAWNMTNLSWTLVSPANVLNTPGFIAENSGTPSPNNRPPSRCCGAPFMDRCGRLYFYGGYGMSSIANQPSSTPDFVGDMWILETANSFSDRAWTWVNGGLIKPPTAPIWGTSGQLVNPGARAWMECWTNPTTNEAFIFGSIGVNARASFPSVPAYYQDFWAFVLPTLPPPPPPTLPHHPSSPVATIVWSTVGGEMLLFLLVFLLLLYRRRRATQSAAGGGNSAYQTDLENVTSKTELIEHNGIGWHAEPSNTSSSNGAFGGGPEDFSPSGLRFGASTPSSQRSYSTPTPPLTADQQDEMTMIQQALGDRSIPMTLSSGSFPSLPSINDYQRAYKKKKNGVRHASGNSVVVASTTTTTTTGSTKTPKKQRYRKSSSSTQSEAVLSTSFVNGTARVGSGEQTLLASFDLMIKRSDLEFGSIIGRGSSGTIYSGRWHGHRVAIKQLATEALVGEREGALEEAKLVSMLRPHPNVIQILGICVTKQHVFIVMTKMHSSLDRLIYHVSRRKWLTTERMYRMAVGIVAGMLHLESQGICHRDLAARNVCLSRNGAPCITDFGMSRKLTISASAGETNTQMGPVAWMAPECFLQKYSSKSDVWSFGILLFEMLSGTVPHAGVDLHQLAIAIRDQGITPSPVPKDADPGLVEIMQSCWHFDPAARPTFAQIYKRLKELAHFPEDESEDDSTADMYTPKKKAAPESPPSNAHNNTVVSPSHAQQTHSTHHNQHQQQQLQHQQHPKQHLPPPETSTNNNYAALLGRSNRTSTDTSKYPPTYVPHFHTHRPHPIRDTQSNAIEVVPRSEHASDASSSSSPSSSSSSFGPDREPSLVPIPTIAQPQPPIASPKAPKPLGHGDYVSGF